MCIELVSLRTGPIRQWYSNEVPCNGLLLQEKIVEKGPPSVNAELLEWGTLDQGD